MSYSLSTSYVINNVQATLSYINTGSTELFINEYKNIKLSISKSILKNVYVEVNYNKRITNSDNDMAFNIGYTYE